MAADLHLTSQVLDDLISAFSGFGGQLATGLTELGQHGDECIRMLRQVGSTFDQLDSELASDLIRGKGHG
jgi:hypothetical protein